MPALKKTINFRERGKIRSGDGAGLGAGVTRWRLEDVAREATTVGREAEREAMGWGWGNDVRTAG